MPAARELGEDVLGAHLPLSSQTPIPRSLPAKWEQAESHIPRLGAALHPLTSLIPPLLSQLQDQASSAHDMATMAVSQGKAMLSKAESLLASLEGKRHQSEHLQPQLGSHQATRGEVDSLVMARLLS